MNPIARWMSVLVAAAILSTLPSRLPADDQKVPALNEKQAAAARDLIGQLGDDNYFVREDATNRLVEMGPGVAPLLAEHKNDRDAEVAWRVSMILEQLPTSSVYRAVRLKKAPTLDGKIDGDEAWKGVDWSTDPFTEVKRQRPSRRNTSFAMGYTAEGLYVAVKCQEPEPQKIKSGKKDREDLFKDDSLELFLLGPGQANYYQLVVNAGGARWNGLGRRPNLNLMAWKAAADTGKAAWTVEIFIPFKMLGAAPTDKGEQWRFNVCRNVTTLPGAVESSAWAPCDNFHAPQKFGRLFFQGTLDEKEAADALK